MAVHCCDARRRCTDRVYPWPACLHSAVVTSIAGVIRVELVEAAAAPSVEVWMGWRMICPRCGERNDLGARRCAACLLPFTRGAAARDARAGLGEPAGTGDMEPEGWPGAADPAGYVAHPDDARHARAPRFPLAGCLAALGIVATTLAVAAVIFVVTSNLVVKPMVRDVAEGEIRAGVRQEVSDQIAAYAAQRAQNGAPAEGAITITQAEINERIDATGDLGPFDDVSVELVDGGVSVELRAYGLSGSYDAALRAEGGSLVLDGGDIDGPLGLLTPTGDLEAAVNEEIAASLLAAGYRVAAVSVVDGALVVTVETSDQ